MAEKTRLSGAGRTTGHYERLLSALKSQWGDEHSLVRGRESLSAPFRRLARTGKWTFGVASNTEILSSFQEKGLALDGLDDVQRLLYLLAHPSADESGRAFCSADSSGSCLKNRYPGQEL